jgi:hypothetical protein
MRINRLNSINVSSRDVIPLKPPDTATTPEIKTAHAAKNQIFGQALITQPKYYTKAGQFRSLMQVAVFIL